MKFPIISTVFNDERLKAVIILEKNASIKLNKIKITTPKTTPLKITVLLIILSWYSSYIKNPPFLMYIMERGKKYIIGYSGYD